MPNVTLEVRPRIAPRAHHASLGGLRALSALATLALASIAVAAPLSTGPHRASAARNADRAARATPVDFAALPSVVGTEYLRNGFDNTGRRAVFILRPVDLPGLLRFEEQIEEPQATSLAPDEVWVGDVIVSGAELRKPSTNLEQFYDDTLRAVPPPGPNDPKTASFTGAPAGPGVERSEKTLDEYLTTPEPTSFVLLCAGGTVMLMRRRRGLSGA
jgi:hypothetical protein